jgi:hypothetical protein
VLLHAGVACAADLRVVAVPPSVNDNLDEKLGQEYLVVAYEDSGRSFTKGICLTGAGDWMREFTGEHFGSVDADESGQTVVVRLGDHESGFTNIVIAMDLTFHDTRQGALTVFLAVDIISIRDGGVMVQNELR